MSVRFSERLQRVCLSNPLFGQSGGIMLTPIEVPLYALALLFIPLATYSLITGSTVPENSPFAKYYRAEKYLGLVSNLFLLALSLSCAVKLGLHFGYIDPEWTNRFSTVTAAAFMLLLVLDLVFWARAALKVRRQQMGDA
jgi:hypothetical protein